MALPELFTVLGHSFSPLGLAVLATSVVVAALGLYPMLGDEPFEESLVFLLLCLAISVWLTGFGWGYGAPNAERALQWLRLAYLGVPVVPAALYTVCASSLGIAARRRRVLAALWTCAALFVVQVVGAGRVFSDVYRYDWGWYPDFTAAGVPLVAFTCLGLAAALWEYWRAYRTASGPAERVRAYRYLTGFGVGGLAAVDYLPAYGVEAYPAGFVAVIAMSAVVGHTIRSYRLTEFTPGFAADRILSTMSDPVVVCDRDARIRVANRAATRILGYSRAGLVGRRVREIVHGRSGAAGALVDAFEGREVVDEEVTLLARDGTPIDVSVSSARLDDDSGGPVGTVVVARDIRQRKQLEDQLRHHALHDRLTGLPNRALYEDRLEQILRLSERRTGSGVGVLYVDLDRFKAINDTMGHPAGDEVLRRVGSRIQGAIREGDTAARLGGDEFAVVLADLDAGSGEEKARQVSRRIVEALERPLRTHDTELRVTASVGIAVADGEEPVDGEELTRRADLAMYAAKADAENEIARFEPELKRRADRRMVVERDLGGAAERGELRLEYQPVVGLGDERPVAFEALVRWDHPELGIVPPLVFIPVAEENGLIREVGGWVLRRACRQMQEWRENGVELPDAARVMVNASPGEVESRAYVDRVRDALERSGLPPEALEVELTERSVADDERGQKFIRSILDLAGELGLEVVAEGVEETSDLEALRSLGVSRAQGFLWAEPLPPEDVESRW